MSGLYIVRDLKKNTYVIILLSQVFNETTHVFLTFLLSMQIPYCQLTKYLNDDTFYNNLLFKIIFHALFKGYCGSLLLWGNFCCKTPLWLLKPDTQDPRLDPFQGFSSWLWQIKLISKIKNGILVSHLPY